MDIEFINYANGLLKIQEQKAKNLIKILLEKVGFELFLKIIKGCCTSAFKRQNIPFPGNCCQEAPISTCLETCLWYSKEKLIR